MIVISSELCYCNVVTELVSAAGLTVMTSELGIPWGKETVGTSTRHLGGREPPRWKKV